MLLFLLSFKFSVTMELPLYQNK